MNPKIICHIMSSVDGRLQTERWTEPFKGKSKGELMGVYASLGRKLDTDAWMFGKNTLTEGYFPKKFHTPDKTPLAHPQAYLSYPTSNRLFVVIDPEADILYESSTVRGDRIVTVLPETAPATYLEYLQQKDISYLFAGAKGDDLNVAMRTLADTFAVESLSLQGGGIIDGAFLQAGLIDELSLVVYPGIDGAADSPSIFEYIGKDPLPAKGQRLELMAAETVQGGIVWLRYKFHKQTGR